MTNEGLNQCRFRGSNIPAISCFPCSNSDKSIIRGEAASVGIISYLVLRFHPFLPTFPTPSSPSPCPKLQKQRQINKNPRSRHTPFTTCLSLYVHPIQSPMTSSRGQQGDLYSDSPIIDNYLIELLQRGRQRSRRSRHHHWCTIPISNT